MPATSIGTLIIDLRAGTAAFAGDLGKAKQLSFNSAREIERSFKVMGTVLVGAMSAAAGATIALVATQIEAAEAMNKASQAAGVSVESLSALKYAADLADVEFEALTKGLGRMSKAMLAAAEKGGAEGPFKHLGITVTEAGGKLRAIEDVLGDVAEKFAAMPSGATKTALAMELFGKSGARLIPFLNQGREGLAGMMEEAKRLGVVISTETAQRAEEFQDNLKRLQASLSGAALAAAERLLPALLDITAGMVAGAKGSKIFQEAGDAAAFTIRTIASAAAIAVASLSALGSLYKTMGGSFVVAARMDPKAMIELFRAGYKEVTGIMEDAGKIMVRLNTEGLGGAPAGKKRGPLADIAIAPKDHTDKIKALIKALEEEAATLGQGTDAKKLYELQTLKAKDSVIEHAKALIQYINTQEIIQAAEKRNYETREGIKKQLTDELNALIYTNEQLQIRKAVLAEATAEELAFIDAVQFEINWLKGLDEETEKNKKATEAWGKQLDQMAASILKSIETPMQRLQEAQSNIIAAWATGRITLSQMLEAAVAADAEVVKKSVEEFKRTDTSMKQFQQDARDMAHAIGTAFEDAILRGKGLRDVFAGLLEDIGRILLRAAITRPLEEALMGKEGRAGTGKLGGLFGFLGTALTGLLGIGVKAPSGGPPPLPPYTGEHFAGGGPVFPGASYLVGERGPELFAPSVPGRIIASSDRAAGAVNVYVDARGADAGAEYAAMRGVARALEQRAVHRAVVTMKEGQARRP